MKYFSHVKSKNAMCSLISMSEALIPESTFILPFIPHYCGFKTKQKNTAYCMSATVMRCDSACSFWFVSKLVQGLCEEENFNYFAQFVSEGYIFWQYLYITLYPTNPNVK